MILGPITITPHQNPNEVVTHFTATGDRRMLDEQCAVLTAALTLMVPLSTITVSLPFYNMAAAVCMQVLSLMEDFRMVKYAAALEALGSMRFYLLHCRAAVMREHPDWSEAEVDRYLISDYAYFAIDWDPILGPAPWV